MKRMRFFAAIAVAAIAAMSITSSCSKEEWSTTHLGIDQEFKGNENPGEEGMRYENTDLSLEFDTLAYQLFTVEQRVYGEKVVFQGEDVLGTESFSRDLNLEVNFSLTPEKVYVAEESLLNEVSLKSQNSSDTTSSEVADEEFTVISYSRDYSFAFNANEKVSANAMWQALKSMEPDTVFAYAEVSNVEYKSFSAKENKALSNTDSTVFDIDLFFDVEVVCESLEFDSVYAVRLPYLRIYKGGEMPDQFFWVVENEAYTAEFDTTACELFTVRQQVSGEEVLYNNEEELSRDAFTKDLNLNALFSVNPEVKYLSSEDGIEEISLSSASKGERTSSNEADGRFTTTSYEQGYEFLFNGGEKVSVATIYQKLAYGDTTFNYASIKDISFKEAASEVVEMADSTICHINLYFNVEVDGAGTFVVRVPMMRVYKPGEIIPDEYTTLVENTGYEAEFQVASLALETKLQEVSGELVVYKNGEEEISRDEFLKALNLEALFTQPERVYVESEEQLTAVSLTNSGHSSDIVKKTADGRFVTASTSLDYNFKFNEGEAVKAGVNYEKLAYGDTTFVYSSIRNIRFNRSEVAENANASNDELKVVTVTLYFDVEVEREDPMAQTKAAEDVTTYTVAVPYERAMSIEPVVDEIIGKRYEDVSREIVDAQTEKISWTEVEIWSVSGEKRSEISLNLYRHFNEPALQWVYTENNQYSTVADGSSKIREEEKKNGNWTITTRYMQYTSTADNGLDPFQNVYSYDYQKAVYTDEYYTLSFDYANWNISENGSSVSSTPNRETVNGVEYDVYNYVNNIKTVYSVTSDSYNATAKAEAKIAIKRVTDEIIGKRYENLSRIIVDAQTEKISWTEVEIWSVSGEKTREISFNLYRHFSEPALQWIYTANNQYTTVANGSSMINETSSQQGNWTVTTRYMQYTSTANNGVTPFQNVYSYDLQKAVYSDEYYTLSFDYADWNISEAGSSVSSTPTSQNINGTTYDVYDYINNINTVYNISGDSYNASAKSEAKIAILPKLIPDEWGKILGAGISAVPADDENPGDYAKKCLVIRTENGAVAVPFAMDNTTPEVNNILAGYFVEGNFGEEYNSGYFTTSANHGSYAVGKWAPAIAKYYSDEYPILYYSDVNTPVRSLSKYILAMWNWRGGNFSHVVDGYTFSVSESGVLTINYNGETVMQLR